jgi:Fe-S cluster assembly protein SufB
LNTKRAIVQKNGIIEWVNGNLGSGVTMLYPCSILAGEGAKSDSLGIAFAGEGQNQDTGSKVIHAASNTSSIIRAKSISKGGGISSYRGLVKVNKNAKNTKCGVECDALLIDDKSVSNTYPFMKIDTNKVDIAHEASVGKIGDEEIFYLMSRGLSEEQAMQTVVSGFIEPIVKELPLEYAVELNKLIELEMEGTVG